MDPPGPPGFHLIARRVHLVLIVNVNMCLVNRVRRCLKWTLQERIISNLSDSSSGFTVSRAIAKSDEIGLWIREDYTYLLRPGGTVHVKNTRRGDHIVVDRATLLPGDDIEEGEPHSLWDTLPVVIE